MADEDISQPAEVHIVEPAQKELALEQPKKPEAQAQPQPQPQPKPPEGKDVLQKQLDEWKQRAELERQGRENAERLARQRLQENQQIQRTATDAQLSAADSQYQSLQNSIDAFKRDEELAKRDYAEALSTGNFHAVAEAQSRMTRAGTQIVQLENGKAYMEQQAQQWKAQQEQQANQPQQREYTQQERFEQYVSQFSPRAQSYLRQHPDYAMDQRLNNRLMRAHGEAVEEHGIQADTEQYYQYLDERMGAGAAPPQQRNVPMRRQPYAAPVSRAPVNGSQVATSVTLTPAEREAARIAGISEVDYAKQMLALEQAGEIVRH